MPYALAYAATAREDLFRLIDSLPAHRQEAAIDAIDRICMAFATGPVHRSGHRGEAPTFPLHFEVEGTRYYWAGTYRLNEEETTLYITHVFRVPL